MTAHAPVRRTSLDIAREIEAFAQALRNDPAFQRKAPDCVPFPDPEGEDRDELRVIEWDFTR